ncbi:MAG: 3-hydroxyacyl-CoA dehydrogenase/enoyl-CoA hydratase family protein [Thermoflexus sp.]|uniref:3-hydroxyacyl-CoA dehydrogenase/enoyl-CoA hydratase family protein n=1 Tax=Thermoflexus sp. TaxID=1969742 RepID=UPI0025D82FCF|nr:3-hydroxyacyl-CoA dehydrogenase/enoyl-CoA hydratase family protein [Thermoflexus sp.]MCS6964224.1 3-hydroxyacyl-CoA dehydrogenase/enoyl-CoA hydratase family protein [Thermoflexus sp.]MDW8064759.1 3-hydroxyacyl-CoA dehydrogenase/enoyl-CoA hydratase family protein [Anaerolineae bacterium]MDW8184955.1 3-hydroxyacyl-CoA dehydrogenase/enoyl-CoA hydratase family protein [Anaerolineae bacterium]
MGYTIRRVAVIGAGTMGAAIAAHLANAGFAVDLLDIPPKSLTPEEEAKGLTLDHPAVRNRIVQAGLERARKAKPAAFFVEDRARQIRIGNTEDHWERLREADWIIEAVVEDLAIKQQVMARIEAVRQPGAIVTTNTSGLPLREIGAGRSPEFLAHFAGTHFFNPPRYLKLVELIPGPATKPEVLDALQRILEVRLGKRVVRAKDTPNFIANRIGFIAGAFANQYTLQHGYTVEEVDALTGPLIGRPKTATFRLLDLVGLDVAAYVGQHSMAALAHDPFVALVKDSPMNRVMATMIERGWLGNKAGQGFYKKVETPGGAEYWPLNLETLEYEPPKKPRWDSVGKALKMEELKERLRFLVAQEDRAGQLVRDVLDFYLAYAAYVAPEVAEDIVAIDQAIRWGFNYELGPFETWDALGVAETVARIEARGWPVAEWVKAFLAAGNRTFYRYENGRAVAYYDFRTGTYRSLVPHPMAIVLKDLKSEGRALERNPSASLIDLGDGVLGLEFHTRANALDPDIFAMMQRALERLDREDWVGMVIGNQGEHFCAGANVFLIAMSAQQGMFDAIEQAVRTMQNLMMTMRYFHKPIVTAPFGMTLGGGAEVAMHGARMVASAETYIGLVEVGVGLIPAGGGCKEMIRRVLTPAMQTENTDPLPFLRRIFETIGMAKVATSAEEGRAMGFLSDADRIVMNPDFLLYEAKREVLRLAESGYRPPLKTKLYAAGRDLLATLRIAVWQMREARYISEHDAKIGEKLAYVLCGGDHPEPIWVDEEHFLDLEREAFLSLCGEPKTQERIWHFLQTGKILRN